MRLHKGFMRGDKAPPDPQAQEIATIPALRAAIERRSAKLQADHTAVIIGGE
jgi:hypothetical protein